MSNFGERMRQQAQAAAQQDQGKPVSEMSPDELNAELKRLEALELELKREAVEAGREMERDAGRSRSIFPQRKKRPGSYS